MTEKSDKSFEDWLDGKSAVNKVYEELKSEQPPDALDIHILAKARRAVGPQDNTVITVRRWRKWSVPVALAATMVFAVPLVVRVFDSPVNDFGGVSAPSLSPLSEAETDRHEATQGLRDLPVAPPPVDNDVAVSSEQDLRIANAGDSVPDSTGAIARSTAKSLLGGGAEPAGFAAAETDANRVIADRTTSPRADVPAAAPVTEAWVAEDSRRSVLRDESRRNELPQSESDTAEFAAAPPQAARQTADVAAQVAAEQTQRTDDREMARYDREPRSLSMQAATPERSVTASQDDGSNAIEEMVVVTGSRIAVRTERDWLRDIVRLERRSQHRAARRELGAFLTEYPDFELPDDFPVDPASAIFPDTGIVQPANEWLKDIAILAEKGQIDNARTELRRFFERYPDYTLPETFPLTRADATAIEQ